MRNIGLGVMTCLALYIAISAPMPYLIRPLESIDSFIIPGFLRLPKLFVYMHIVAAMIAMLLGPTQFIHQFRNRFLAVHRWLGRIYLIAVLFGGIGGIIISSTSPAGLVGTVGFSMLGSLWLYTGLRAYLSIRAGRIRDHRHWMTRNFALTFAAVTLRIYLGLGIGLGWGIPSVQEAFNGNIDLWTIEVYRVVPFACWVPNILVAEAIIARDQKKWMKA